MKKIKIAGVPEHFNLPWLDAVEAAAVDAAAVQWVAEPQGTGAMVAGLDAGTFDAALLLTEGAVAAVAAGSRLAICGTWVESPLQWGIHVPAASDIAAEAAIRGRRYAISRRGSGSHLMACAHARARDWPVDEMNFVTVGTIDGARAAFADGHAEVFFWERYMTAPLVDAGEFRRVGVFEAPWPAFVLCIATAVSEVDRQRILNLYSQALDSAQRFAGDAEATTERVSRTFGIEAGEAAAWLARTRWATRPGCDVAGLERAAEVLLGAGLIAALPAFV